MEIVILLLVVFLGFILLVSNSVRKKNMADILLFSILLVLAGISFIVFTNIEAFSYVGLCLSVIGLLLGTTRFFMSENSETENL